MSSIIKISSSDYDFFPSGSFDSRKDSDFSDLYDSKGISKNFSTVSIEEIPNQPINQFIPYEEITSKAEKPNNSNENYADYQNFGVKNTNQLVIFPKAYISKSYDDFPSIIYQDISDNFIDFEEELKKCRAEKENLAKELEFYKALYKDYESSINTLKTIFENITSVSHSSLKFIPKIDDTSIHTIKSSLESISSYILNFSYKKSTRVSSVKNDSVRTNNLVIEDFSEKCLILDSPEPPKNCLNLMKKKGNSISRLEKFFAVYPEPKSSAKNKVQVHESHVPKQINFKSVSPILKTKYKSLISQKNK